MFKQQEAVSQVLGGGRVWRVLGLVLLPTGFHTYLSA